MTQVVNQTGHPIGRAGRTLSLVYMLAVLVVMALSGLVALEEGTHRLLLPLFAPDALQQFHLLGEAARANPGDTNMWPLGAELWGLSRLVSNQHFLASKLVEHGGYYASMPKANQVSLVLHVLFSVFCMLAGGLQFWPAFRKRFLKVHRVIGATYVVTVPIGTLAAMVYLWQTPPYEIYDNLVAWIALWVFAGLALLSVAMAVRAIKARRIFEHQAWMALSFGALAVAPLLRWDWVFLAWAIPGMDQETLNLVTMSVMLPETLLMSYGLILINRQYARPMTQRKSDLLVIRATAVFQRLTPVFFVVSLILLAVDVLYYMMGHGMASLHAAARWIPAALVEREHAALLTHPLLAGLFALCLGLAFPLCIRTFSGQLGTAPAPLTGADTIGPVLAGIAGIASCFLGTQIGLAHDMALLSGGTMYVTNGVILMSFSLLFLGAQRAGRQPLVKESLVFLLCMLPFPAMFVLSTVVIGGLPMPAIYAAAGQGFLIPAGAGASLVFLAMFYVVYGQATREYN